MYETSEGTKYKTRAEALYKKAPIDIGASKGGNKYKTRCRYLSVASKGSIYFQWQGKPSLAQISIGAYTHRASARDMYETSEGTKYKTRAEALYKKAPIDIGASKDFDELDMSYSD